MDVPGVALITGAGSGIGRACALTFARDGASGIALLDINPDALSAVKAEIEQLYHVNGTTNGGAKVNGNHSQTISDGKQTNGHTNGTVTNGTKPSKTPSPADEETLNNHRPSPRVETYAINVSDETQVTSALSSASQAFGRIDYVVNAAGIAVKHPGGVAHASTADWDRLLAINLTGTFYILRAASRLMLSQTPLLSSIDGRPLQRGSIVNISSIQGVVGIPLSAAYATTKAGVLGLTRSASEDYAAQGIRVNAICPGYTETPLTTRDPMILEAMMERVKGAVPMGRMAKAEEIADGVVFLCGGRSSFVTGTTLLVDGGFTQR